MGFDFSKINLKDPRPRYKYKCSECEKEEVYLIKLPHRLKVHQEPANGRMHCGGYLKYKGKVEEPES